MKLFRNSFLLFIPIVLLGFLSCSNFGSKVIHIYCNETNDVYEVLQTSENVRVLRYNNIERLMNRVRKGESVMILADNYPEETLKLPDGFFDKMKSKKAHFYVEYAQQLPGIVTETETIKPKYQRAIVNSSFFGKQVDSLAILSVSGLRYIPAKVPSAHIVAGRVAGLDHAEYGLPKETSPLLFEMPEYSGIVATTSLSKFIKGRYAPKREWQFVWKAIFRFLIGEDMGSLKWSSVVQPYFGRNETLPEDVQKQTLKRGIDWFQNARMLIPENYDQVIADAIDPTINTGFLTYSEDIPIGDGSNGVFECIFSKIDESGNQPIGVVRRADCTGETAMAFATAGKALNNKEHFKIAENLLNYYLTKSPATKNEYGDPNHGAYGLVAWGFENFAWYRANYGDDNARLMLGTMITSAITGNEDWDPILMKLLLAQLRTTGKNGFRGDRIDLPDLEKNGWRHFYDRDFVSFSPHMEAYLWACMLWAYDKTGDPIFLERTKNAIKATMNEYTDGWRWMNGLAQEKARILLPLAWLVRINDTKENRDMLYKAIDGLLELQGVSGAIREELGKPGRGVFPPTRRNEDYGSHEASLIAKNGDKVSDLLYTTNFAFLGLHEAYYATKDERIKKAADKLAEFLCRIQVKSENHPELDGGWMRAFDYGRFEHWGSNSDAGWGAWAIEGGWTQGWITTVLALREMDTSVWDLTKDSKVGDHHESLKKEMLPGL
ncbi:hypothetical protein [Seonamhaeicola sp.]|uniref:hypothetical protein n=1 Tax=Seonamhaeicola sp. TaxID=1912245 RepID=UPI00261EF833|nr:hypothetical protein [Seonamhaeicola sp.]